MRILTQTHLVMLAYALYMKEDAAQLQRNLQDFNKVRDFNTYKHTKEKKEIKELFEALPTIFTTVEASLRAQKSEAQIIEAVILQAKPQLSKEQAEALAVALITAQKAKFDITKLDLKPLAKRFKPTELPSDQLYDQIFQEIEQAQKNKDIDQYQKSYVLDAVRVVKEFDLFHEKHYKAIKEKYAQGEYYLYYAKDEKGIDINVPFHAELHDENEKARPQGFGIGIIGYVNYVGIPLKEALNNIVANFKTLYSFSKENDILPDFFNSRMWNGLCIEGKLQSGLNWMQQTSDELDAIKKRKAAIKELEKAQDHIAKWEAVDAKLKADVEHLPDIHEMIQKIDKEIKKEMGDDNREIELSLGTFLEIIIQRFGHENIKGGQFDRKNPITNRDEKVEIRGPIPIAEIRQEIEWYLESVLGMDHEKIPAIKP